MKDIFIDNNVASRFKNPADEEYKKLLNWITEKGHLVLSQKLLKEYISSNRGNFGQSIITVIDRLTRENRIARIENTQLKTFFFPSHIEKKINKLRMNIEDYDHLKAIILSNRKIGIVIDEKLRLSVNDYPNIDGIKPQAVSRPEQIDYENYEP